LQQLEYKIVGKIGNAALAQQMKDLFLSSYLEASGQKLTPALEERLALYYNWTALRTAIYWFLKFGHDEKRASELLDSIKNNLGIIA